VKKIVLRYHLNCSKSLLKETPDAEKVKFPRLDMMQARHWLWAFSCSLVVSALSIAANTTSAYAVSLESTLAIPGESTDLFPLNGSSGGANINRLGFFSDIYYDRYENVYYGLGDRGAGGGVLSYQTRVQKFSLDVDPNTGAISNFNVLKTILFTKDGENFNGLNPTLLNGDAGNLGLSFDRRALQLLLMGISTFQMSMAPLFMSSVRRVRSSKHLRLQKI
jgi:hypothetical protein